MPEFIYHLTSFELFAFLSIVLFTLSFISITLVRKHIALDFRYEENTAIVCCSALLGIIYAILIGFTILYETNCFDYADKAEDVEGKVLYNIYRNAAYLPNPEGEKIRTLVLSYAQNAIQNEWPAMAAGKIVDAKGRTIIDNLVQELSDLNTQAKTSNAYRIISQDINTLFEIHHLRVSKLHTTLNSHMWFVILLATLITLGINFLLGMEYRLHLFCGALISLVLAAILYLLVGLDRPYQGDFATPPDTIGSILEFAENGGNQWADNHLTLPQQAVYFSH